MLFIWTCSFFPAYIILSCLNIVEWNQLLFQHWNSELSLAPGWYRKQKVWNKTVCHMCYGDHTDYSMSNLWSDRIKFRLDKKQQLKDNSSKLFSYAYSEHGITQSIITLIFWDAGFKHQSLRNLGYDHHIVMKVLSKILASSSQPKQLTMQLCNDFGLSFSRLCFRKL